MQFYYLYYRHIISKSDNSYQYIIYLYRKIIHYHIFIINIDTFFKINTLLKITGLVVAENFGPIMFTRKNIN